jgi:hypothetical protein
MFFWFKQTNPWGTTTKTNFGNFVVLKLGKTIFLILQKQICQKSKKAVKQKQVFRQQIKKEKVDVARPNICIEENLKNVKTVML